MYVNNILKLLAIIISVHAERCKFTQSLTVTFETVSVFPSLAYRANPFFSMTFN